MDCAIEPADVWPAKDPAEKLDYAVNFEPGLLRRWIPGAHHEVDDRVRPTKPNGYQLKCTVAGQSGSKEPTTWPTTVGETITEGSVTWQCEAISDDGLVATLDGTPNWTAEAGVTVSAETADGQMAFAKIEGGADGEDYSILIEAPCTDGTTRVKRAILPVRIPKRVCSG